MRLGRAPVLRVGRVIPDSERCPSNQLDLLLSGSCARSSSAHLAPNSCCCRGRLVLDFLSLGYPGAPGFAGKSQGRGSGPRGTPEQERRLPDGKRQVRAPFAVHLGCREGAGPCSLQLPWWPGLGRELVLISGLPALTGLPVG